MLPFAIQTVLLLIIIGGAIAYIGNYVGRKIGKRRLTIFSLRPRYTAITITILSGILIALCTLSVLLLISQDARTALLGLEKLKQEISQRSAEVETTRKELASLEEQRRSLEENLKAAEKEVRSLQNVRENLSRRVEQARRGTLLFRVGEEILISLIRGGADKQKLEVGLKGILSSADSYIRTLGVKSEKHLIFMAPEDFDQAVADLSTADTIYVAKLISTRNVIFGEEIPARFEIIENRLVYHKDDVIAMRDLASGLTSQQIEQEIMKGLRAAHARARQDGLIPDSSGSIGGIPYSQISELAKKIKTAVALKIQAAKDIYLTGPLEVVFRISYK